MNTRTTFFAILSGGLVGFGTYTALWSIHVTLTQGRGIFEAAEPLVVLASVSVGAGTTLATVVASA